MSSKHSKAETAKKASKTVTMSNQQVAEPATNATSCSTNTVAVPSTSGQVTVVSIDQAGTGAAPEKRMAGERRTDKSSGATRAAVIQESDCPLCDEPNDMEMVQCDTCQRWFHFRCVKVTQDIQNVSWSCTDCPTVSNQQRTTAPVPTQNQTLPTQSQTAKSVVKSIQSEARRRLKLQLLKIEEEKKLEQKYLKKKYDVLLEYGSDTSTEISVNEAEKISKIEEWVADTERCDNQANTGLEPEEMEELLPIQLAGPTEQTAPNLEQGTVQLTNPQHPVSSDVPGIHRVNPPSLIDPRMFVPGQRSTPMRPSQQVSMPPSAPHVANETVCILNRSQLAARQAVSKDLPEFSGNPEDWPLFFSNFSNSTQMCGFSNEENMLRLRKCLKGRALEAVKCRLLHPFNVAGVMSTLKMLYGRPEAIIQAIVKNVRSLPSPNIDRLETVVNFALTVENLVATIQACEVHDFVYNASLRYELVERLPSTLKLDWAKHSRDKLNPNLLDFSSWLYSTAEDASAVMATINNDPKPRSIKKDGFLNIHSETESGNNRSYMSPSKVKPTSFSGFEKHCPICKGGCQSVPKCKRFAEFSYDSRWAAVRECKLCRKCLRKHNGSCRQQKPCGISGCIYLHHPLLHSEKQQSNSSSNGSITATLSEGTSQQSCNIHQGQSKVLFRILPVRLYGPSKTVQAFAFIDDGSELSLMDQSLAEELGLKGPRKSLCLKWTGETQRLEKSSQIVSLQISSCFSQAKRYELCSVHTVQSLQIRPQTLLYSEIQKKYQHLVGLPIQSYENACPRILIGLDNLNLGHPLKCKEGQSQEPIGVKTRLGWTVYGSCVSEDAAEHSVNYHSLQICQCNQYNDEDLHRTVKSFFSLESIGITKPERPLQSQDDQRALMLLESLTIFRDGRYETGLLFKYDNVRLPNNKEMALKRWQCLDRRMKHDRALAEAVNAKIEDHIEKGYIRKLTDEEVQAYPNVWYLPMFPVVNPNKPGKIRLVWDAAATTYGVSLNSVLLKGPDLLTSLLSVLIQFRECRIAVSGDIREMYQQVSIRKKDQPYQLFFYTKSGINPNTYVIQVMTFGACCSPSTAQYIKNLHARKFEQSYPTAVEVIVERHYVDDMLLSVEHEEEAIKLTREVRKIHASAGFDIRNWASNSPAVLKALDESPTAVKRLSGDGSVEKILGMWWDTSTDNITFKISDRIDALLLSGTRRPTKREVLRTLMMVFDPLGLIGHFLMILKTLFQEIWRSSIGWDDSINDSHFEKWSSWCVSLPGITTLQIPRCYRTKSSIAKHNDIQLHTFVDASETGFAAVVYLRFQEDTTIECALVGSKTRVSPIKFLSIPRSELQAAIIGVRLAETVKQSLSIKIRQRYFWTDSKDVLCWLNSDHRRYSQFVAFRVSELLESSDVREWNWIPSKQNVADEGTKWKTNPDLSASSRWFRGPEFLWKSTEHWPMSNSRIGVTTEELRPHLLFHTKIVEPVIDLHRFSDWRKLIRCTAHVFRYINNLKSCVYKKNVTNGPLQRRELSDSECCLFRMAQNYTYADEITILSRNRLAENPDKTIPRNSPLFHKCVFLDENDVLRVRGRTRACQFIARDAAQPIILPREHPITRLILLDFHKRFNHQNHETILNEIRQRFHVPRLKGTYRKVRRECQKCKNDQASPQPPAMSDLPPYRLAAFTGPFTYMGIDYFGPMTVVVGRRSEKRWGVLATCLTTRAIHLELAHTLTTDSCILAIRNVMARRGTPAVIFSDRGTNFQGASKELKEVLQDINQEQLMREFTTSNTEWTFIPPASPHMGGAWERLIGSVKCNLHKLQWRKLPTDEVLYSTLLEIENNINSRPLTDIPMDDDESPVLTPNHFLLGSSNGLKPWVQYNDNPIVLRNSWRQSQVMANEFWRQWLRDYLLVITRRTKWFMKVKPIQVNDVVVIADPKAPRNSWPMGRIIATRAGQDGQVRSATIQTNQGIYERPAVKLAVLDVGVRNQYASGEPSAHSGRSVNTPVDLAIPSYSTQ
ncbi:uncharacterized protein LOC129770031 [Toxorhynchites rutilus septentrionalis]|uniref:uncharacterized protein LOC129770031 n=1 Tax=Toxorhynchites rutilus septentrionalis TaxID=329112 RepID=UPI002479F1F7|nr:uncharacterized protein LOC129770031 [Toxorhynchites rutilus septentrionalis]XP_055628588.1 uncharacterized protein LOC129770031 [Toxorhynchites rutilus septentrionalis]XP_055628589.1 uncharacterized protein LOC129770031 [Toxorhynchites rutilus septentrionalis]